MPALSSPSTWRQSPYRCLTYVFVLKPTVVFAAQVNQATIPVINTQITFDNVSVGSFSDIKPGMTVWFGSTAGANDLGITRIRAAASSTVLQIARTPPGVLRGEALPVDNAYITVVNLYEVWSKIPFINDSGVSVKDQTSFASNIAQPPIANGGPAVAGFVDSGTSLLTVNFTAANSTIVDASASALTYSWDFVDGTPSTASTVTVTGVTFPAGFRYVSLTVSDGTRSHTTRIPVYAATRTGSTAPQPLILGNQTLKPEGQEVTLTLQGNSLSLSDYPRGTLAIVFSEEFYGSSAGSLAGTAGRQNVKFVGWLGDEDPKVSTSADGLTKQVTFKAQDVLQKLAKCPAFSDEVVRKTSPTSWAQMKTADIDRFWHFKLHWHSTAAEVAPVTLSGTWEAYPFPVLATRGDTMYDQLANIADAIGYKVTCSSQGELMVRPDPMRQPVSSRTAVEIVALGDDDWTNDAYTDKQPEFHWIRGSGIIASATSSQPVFCISPSPTPGQGQQTQDIGQQLVTSANDLYVRIGHDYARANAIKGEITLDLTHNGDAGIEPAFMEWVTFTSSVTTPRGVTVAAGERYLVKETVINYTHEHLRRQVSLRLEKEASGHSAVRVKPPTSTGGTPPSLPSVPPTNTYPSLPEDPGIFLPPSYPPGIPTGGTTTPNVISTDGGTWINVMSDNRLLLTQNGLSASPTFQDITPPLATGYTLTHAIWSGFGTDIYAIANNGTYSQVFYAQYGLSGTWATRTLLTGVFHRLKATSTQGHVYAQNTRTNQGEYLDTLSTALGSQTVACSATYPFGFWTANSGGAYQPTGGRGIAPDGCIAGVNVGTFSSFARYDATIVVDLGQSRTVMGASLWQKASASGKSHTVGVYYYNASKSLITSFTAAGNTTTYWQHSVLGTGSRVAAVRYVAFVHEMKVTDGQPFLDDLNVIYENNYTDALTSGLGTKTQTCSATYPFGFWTPNSGGAWSATGGNTGGCIMGVNVGSFSGFARYDATIVVDLGLETTLRSASCDLAATVAGKAHTCRIDLYDGNKTFISTAATYGFNTDTAWNTLSYSGAAVNKVRYVVFVHECKVADAQPILDNLVVVASTGVDVVHSSDGFVSNTTYLTVGTRGARDWGFDTGKIANTVSVATEYTVLKKNTADGGTYSTYTGESFDGAGRSLIFIPRYDIGSASVQNDTTSPDFFRGQNGALYSITASGVTQTLLGSFGSTSPLSPDSLVSPWWSGDKAVYVSGQLDTGIQQMNITTTNISTWSTLTNVGIVGSGSLSISPIGGYVALRRGDSAMQQIYVTDQDVWVSQDFGTTWTRVAIPASSETVFAMTVEVYG